MRPSMARLRTGLREVAPAIYRAHQPLNDLRLLSLGNGIAPQEQPAPPASEPGWKPAAIGTRWGSRDETVWVSATADVPEQWVDAAPKGYAIALRLLLGSTQDFGWPEGLLYIDGHLWQGFNRWHPDVLLPQDLRVGTVRLDARVWSGMRARDHRIEAAEIALLSLPVERLSTLLAMGVDQVDALAEADPLLHPLAAALDAAYDHLDLRDPGAQAFETSAREALDRLEATLGELRDRFSVPGRPRVTAVGHGHLDVAWLWQTRHTREKTARTFSIATALMERFPDYIFLHTTPQVYDWLRADYPDVYNRVRARVLSGQFEAAGAMWLESDCNLVSGEALVRQIFYGQRFLREEFGREYDVLWLPDAFGYSAALPQILLKSGLIAFMTTKLSWSEVNRIPTDTFRWRGLDGSETLGHFITTPVPDANDFWQRTDTYNGVLTVQTLQGIWERYRDKGINDELLLAFGYGDGGAGPTRQQLLQGQALMALPGLPELRFGRADEYFARLRERVWGSQDLPTWDGELYLEYHRGTYTTQAWLKRAHRHNEQRLLTAEFLDAWLHTFAPESAPDLRSRLDAAWHTLLLHEFHDILPGSSITEVYQDAREAMDMLSADLDATIGESLAVVARALPLLAGSTLIFNPAPFARQGVTLLPSPPEGATWVDAGSKSVLPSQASATVANTVATVLPEVPALGFLLLSSAPQNVAESGDDGVSSAPALTPESRTTLVEHADGFMLENAFVRAEISRGGEIVSLVDLRLNPVRELLPGGGRANQLQLFEDRPRNFDAWDIDPWYERKPYTFETTEAQAEETGPLRVGIRVTHRLGASTVTQTISLTATSPALTFQTIVEWHAHHLLLKVAFPLDLRVRAATYETQFGAVTRPTTRNTSWESAQYEVPAHRWADLSEADYGVSLLNDGRYGHDVRDNVLRLTLLRSPTSPDARADQGISEVTYQLLPHLGDWRHGTVAAAWALNAPPLVYTVPGSLDAEAVNGSALPPAALSLFQVSEGADAVVLSAVKRAADGEGLIVRAYEATGARVWARIEATRTVERVAECDLLERPLISGASPAYPLWAASPAASHDAPVADTTGWSFQLRPYEVRTFRVRLTSR